MSHETLKTDWDCFFHVDRAASRLKVLKLLLDAKVHRTYFCWFIGEHRNHENDVAPDISMALSGSRNGLQSCFGPSSQDQTQISQPTQWSQWVQMWPSNKVSIFQWRQRKLKSFRFESVRFRLSTLSFVTATCGMPRRLVEFSKVVDSSCKFAQTFHLSWFSHGHWLSLGHLRRSVSSLAHAWSMWICLYWPPLGLLNGSYCFALWRLYRSCSAAYREERDT